MEGDSFFSACHVIINISSFYTINCENFSFPLIDIIVVINIIYAQLFAFLFIKGTEIKFSC